VYQQVAAAAAAVDLSELTKHKRHSSGGRISQGCVHPLLLQPWPRSPAARPFLSTVAQVMLATCSTNQAINQLVRLPGPSSHLLSGPLLTCCEALWVDICLTIHGCIPQLSYCKVYQHLPRGGEGGAEGGEAGAAWSAAGWYEGCAIRAARG